MAELAKRRRRVYHAKVKSGCRTCKVRHMKCDETRPVCIKCQDADMVCDGYGVWGGGSKEVSSIHQHAVSMDSLAPKVHMLPRAISRHNTPCSFDISDQEQVCFDYFRCRTASKIAGVFWSPFWDDLVMRAGSTDLAVMHAAVALASAHRSAELNLYGSSSPPRPSSSCGERRRLDDHEAFALQQYNKAIAQLRTLGPGGGGEAADDTQLRTMLITCVLFVSLELLRGDHTSALMHTRHGLNLLVRLKKDVRIQGVCLRRAPESVDDHLVEAFTRLSLHSTHFGVVADSLFTAAQQQKFFAEWKVPRLFRDMFQARKSFDTLLGAILTLCKQCHRDDFAGAPHSAETLEKHRRLQTAAVAWLQTYTASVPTLQRTTDARNALGIPLLRIYHTMASVMVSTVLSPGEGCFDEFTPAFTSILAQCVAIYRQSSTSPYLCDDARISGFSFTVELGTIPLLNYVAVKCRVPWLRRQAIAMLLAAPHREGIWDGVVVAHTARRVVELEEDGFFDNTLLDLSSAPFQAPQEKNQQYLERVPRLPEESRFRQVQVSLSRHSSAAGTLVCKRRSDQEAGWTEVVEEFDFSHVDRGDPMGVDFPA